MLRIGEPAIVQGRIVIGVSEDGRPGISFLGADGAVLLHVSCGAPDASDATDLVAAVIDLKRRVSDLERR